MISSWPRPCFDPLGVLTIVTHPLTLNEALRPLVLECVRVSGRALHLQLGQTLLQSRAHAAGQLGDDCLYRIPAELAFGVGSIGGPVKEATRLAVVEGLKAGTLKFGHGFSRRRLT